MAEGQLSRKRQILLKLEAVSGVAETLASADGRMRVSQRPEAVPVANRTAREQARESLTQLSGIPGYKGSEIKWKMEATGSGAAANAPEVDAALQACGMGKYTAMRIPIGAVSGGTFLDGDAITSGAKTGRLVLDHADSTGFLTYVHVSGAAFANTDVITNGTASATASSGPVAAGFEYKSISTGFQTATVRSEEDGYQKSIRGAVGTWKLAAEANKPGYFEFAFKGPIVSFGDQAMTAVTGRYTTQPPILQNARMAVDAYAAVLKSISYDQANTTVMREDGNEATGLKPSRISGRRPVGTLVMEMMNASDYDVWNKFLDGTAAKVKWRLGTVPGNIIWVKNPRINFSQLSDQEIEGISTVGADFEANGVETSADDEVSLLFL